MNFSFSLVKVFECFLVEWIVWFKGDGLHRTREWRKWEDEEKEKRKRRQLNTSCYKCKHFLPCSFTAHKHTQHTQHTQHTHTHTHTYTHTHTHLGVGGPCSTIRPHLQKCVSHAKVSFSVAWIQLQGVIAIVNGSIVQAEVHKRCSPVRVYELCEKKEGRKKERKKERQKERDSSKNNRFSFFCTPVAIGTRRGKYFDGCVVHFQC